MLGGLSPSSGSEPLRLPSPEDAGAAIRTLMPGAKIAYVGMAADLIHFGHINIINESAKLGKVVVGVLTDEAVASYKRTPVVSFEDRAKVIQAIKGVTCVVPQTTLDYVPNLRKVRPDFVVHGSDWRTGKQAATRQKIIDCLAEWGGRVEEPEHTEGISTTDLIKRCVDRMKEAGEL